MVVFEITKVWRWDGILANDKFDKENFKKEILFRDVERENLFF